MRGEHARYEAAAVAAAAAAAEGAEGAEAAEGGPLSVTQAADATAAESELWVHGCVLEEVKLHWRSTNPTLTLPQALP